MPALPERLPCTCTAALTRRRAGADSCPTCAAWGEGWVLLQDGTRLHKMALVVTLLLEEPDPDRTARGF